ncbi:MAG: TM0106 family RecB-like putative nuclease, partial [Acidobacteria bacterium]|nr:TM0106 family RecB-like putative nuclease [Acidobacteriota bacterium]
LDFPGEVQPDPEDEGNTLFQTKGFEHEAGYLSQLKRDGADVCEISDRGDRYSETIDAIRAGRGIIYQAALRHEPFSGFADFLVRAEGASKLGDYHYEVWDTKLAHKAKPYFLVQLCCYAEMIGALQEVRPAVVTVVLGNRHLRHFRTEEYYYYYLRLKQAFLDQQAGFHRDQKPIPAGEEECGRWSRHGLSIIESLDHLSQVANIRSTQIRRLESAGIKSMTDLARTRRTHIPNLNPTMLHQLRHQARLQLESKGLTYPGYEVLDPDPLNPRRGLARLPPPSKLDIGFDIEGYPLVEGGLEYLFGVTYENRRDLAFKCWWAHDRHAEKAAFEGFIDWVFKRWRKDPEMHIYHYAAYEVTALRRLMGRFGTRELEVDELLRNEVFVDLYTIVRQGLRIGEPAYSLKNIERLYAGRREGEVATAADSLLFYQRWLESGHGSAERDSRLLSAIESYNKEDCDSTWRLCLWLREVQHSNGIAWVPKPPAPDEAADTDRPRSEAAELAGQLLATIPEDRSKAPERWRIQELLAWLLEFHWREAKPVFWAMFDRHAMTEDQLYDDVDCLAGLKRTGRGAEPVAKSCLYEYQFNPEQETKLSEGGRCYFAHDLRIGTTIEEIDTDAGRIRIRVAMKHGDPPAKLSLIPDEHVPARAIAASIMRIASKWRESGELPRALADFLYRRRPRIRGSKSGPIAPSGPDQVDSAVKAIVNLDHGTLCIQGPPGSGKTYTAARAIVELVQMGKRVGITSNSHKAILQLMQAAIREAGDAGIRIDAVKIGGDREDLGDYSGDIRWEKSGKEVFGPLADLPQLVGGTAWAFSDETAAAKLDYLFVDEAGQVSVANLVGMSPCSGNLVVVGDQMQLSQPIKGSHPGESGRSVLDYILGDQATVPEDFGIFLSSSRRMHPDVCGFISAAVYEGRLHAAKASSDRRLFLPTAGGKWLTRESGVLFVPVDHEGNTQASEEEIDAIRGIVDELLQCRLTDEQGARRRLTMRDMLLVAPYNLQVMALKRAFPLGHAGSVDKFQGQEAALVIVSMCASSGDASPRGVEFLFSRNRLNVAISRAQLLAVVVGSPALARTRCSTVEQVELVNLFCRIVEAGGVPSVL